MAELLVDVIERIIAPAGRRAVDLARISDVIDAHRRHLLLPRRYGWAAAYDAVLTGLMVARTSGPWTTPVALRFLGHLGRLPPHPDPFDQDKQDYVDYSTPRLFAHRGPPLPAGVGWPTAPTPSRPASSRRSQAASATPTARPTAAATPYRPLGPRRLLADPQPTPDHLNTRPRTRHPARPRGEPARPARERRQVVQPQPPVPRPHPPPPRTPQAGPGCE